jgi:hypothetical protein
LNEKGPAVLLDTFTVMETFSTPSTEETVAGWENPAAHRAWKATNQTTAVVRKVQQRLLLRTVMVSVWDGARSCVGSKLDGMLCLTTPLASAPFLSSNQFFLFHPVKALKLQ